MKNEERDRKGESEWGRNVCPTQRCPTQRCPTQVVQHRFFQAQEHLNTGRTQKRKPFDETLRRNPSTNPLYFLLGRKPPPSVRVTVFTAVLTRSPSRGASGPAPRASLPRLPLRRSCPRSHNSRPHRRPSCTRCTASRSRRRREEEGGCGRRCMDRGTCGGRSRSRGESRRTWSSTCR